MEAPLSQFLPALASIVVIDLALAGANAIVILLAAGKLSAPLKRRAIVWGALIAILVRTKLTLLMVSLLKTPYLELAGGAVLLWAAFRFLTQHAEDETRSAGRAATFRSVMQTIVVADVVIGLDNVLAVVGASDGDTTLVPLGLVVSIVILLWGAGPILRLIAALPSSIYFAGAVIAWTAAKMIAGEAFVNEWLDASGIPEWPVHASLILGTLSLAWLANRRRTSTGNQP